MTESAMPQAWVDEVLNGVEVDISEKDPEVDAKDSASALGADAAHVFQRCIGYSFSKQLEELTLGGPAPLAKRAILTSRPKQRFNSSKARQFSGVRTDAARRMEIAQLKLEVPELEARIDYLMQRAVSRAGHLPSLEKSRLINDKLREMARHQRLWIARGMSAISQSLPQCSRPLLNYSIHLPLDTSSRVKMLCDLKGDILRDGREILHERMRFLSSDFLPRYELSSHTTAEGDACASLFATVPVEGGSSVKDVLDALREVVSLDEVFTCQTTGTCCIADAVDSHPDLEHSGIAHRRCVRLKTSGRVIELKGVLFSEYGFSSSDKLGTSSGCNASEHATVVIHSVEDDLLHPYSEGRMRLDITIIISIHHHRRHSQKYRMGSDNDRDANDGIVIARTSFVKLRRSGVPISASDMQAEMDYILSKGPEAVETILESVHLRQNSIHESSRDRDVHKFPQQLTPLQVVDGWPSGDLEISTA